LSLFRVWSPTANSVELVTPTSRTRMRAAEQGWWALDMTGMDYAFSLDGGPPLPDPRSGWQPSGVHGMSRRVDHDLFDWTDEGWQAPPLGSAIVYEMHVGTFTPEGTFDSAIERLDHLQQLGVTHVEIMPVAEFPGTRGWGYDGVALYAPHHAYGGPDALKRLVNACHEQGLAVLLDVVYNHLGPDGNYLSQFGPYFTDKYATPWGQAVNLDGEASDEVRRFFIDNALMWLREYHFDGLRLDAVHAIVDTSAVHFLEELALQVAELEIKLGRHLVLVAESDRNDPRLLWARERGGYGLTAQWSDDFHHALHALLTGERNGYYTDFGRIEHVARALEHGYVYDGRYSDFRKKHHGRPAEGVSGDRFIGCVQNHDQIGNRARGERSTHLMSVGRLKVGAALLLTSPFTPMLFQGEEWAASAPFLYFTDHQDANLGRAVTEGRRTEFAAFSWDMSSIPDPQAETSFLDSKLSWDEISDETHAGILEWYRHLIQLRRRSSDLSNGRMDETRVTYEEDQAWIVIQRGSIMVASNLSSAVQEIPLPCDASEILQTSDVQTRLCGNSVRLSPNSVAILRSPTDDS
jgi:maltooligosyltrehalose trehalohydrolase